jgi:alanyl-tRNA synthetase
LGEHARQEGSFVEPGRLRFDFTHFKPLSDDEIRVIEDCVNEIILANIPVEKINTTLDQAKKIGAMAIFGEKYGDVVRVVKISDYSIELCGGIHLDNTGEIGLFKIVSQEAAAAGIRRVEAIVGLRLFENLRKSVNIIKEISQILGTDKDLIKKVYDFQERLKELEKLHQETGAQLARIKANELVKKLKKEKLKIIAQQFNKYSPDAMRLTADFIRKDVNDCIGILYQKVSGKINYLIFVGQDLVKEHPANKLIKEISKILGGGGGGKPYMAEGGGGDPKRIPDAINYLKTKITNTHL